MKITKRQLKQIIKEELEAVSEQSQYEEGSVGYHIEDAIQMLKSEEDTSGTLFQVINRLEEALDTLDNDPGYGMIDDRDQLDEAHGLSKADAKTLKDFADDHLDDSDKNKKVKDIIKFLIKSNVEVDKTQDVTKMKKKESKK